MKSDTEFWDKVFSISLEKIDKDNLKEVMQSSEYQSIKLPEKEETRLIELLDRNELSQLPSSSASDKHSHKQS